MAIKFWHNFLEQEAEEVVIYGMNVLDCVFIATGLIL